MEKKPVIIGSSVSAMAVSRRLSADGIPHVMIGPPPNTLPKLGESMNPEGSTELMNLFADYRECFHDKPHTTIAVGRFKVDCDFGALRAQRRVDAFLNTLSPGIHIPKQMLHIDRIAFDRKLYDETQKSEYLEIINAKVTGLTHSSDTQEIQSITLDTGDTLEPRFVFDCTNHGRLVGRALHIPVTFLSEKQRVVFAHYQASSSPRSTRSLWESGTNLLRVEKDRDGMEGFAWCIPLGDYVSVGLTTDADNSDAAPTSEAMMETLEKAFDRRGLDFTERFQVRSQVMDLSGKYFKHEKAFGPNWVMVGGSYCQIWFMSGSGLGTALSCASMATHFLKNPLKAGRAYQKYMDAFLKTHWPVDWFVRVDHVSTSPSAFRKNVFDWLLSNLTRLTLYPQIRMRPWNNLLGDVAGFLMRRGIVPTSLFRLERYCPTRELAEGELMWNPSAPATVELKKDVIVRLTETISGIRPIGYANTLLHPAIKLWMDGVPFRGRWFWKAWVMYLRHKSNVKNIKLVLEDARLHQNVLHMKAGWYGTCQSEDGSDREERLQDVFGEMEVHEGKIVEIKTRKSNYTALLGDDFLKKGAFFKLFFVIAWWSLGNVRAILGSHDIH